MNSRLENNLRSRTGRRRSPVYAALVVIIAVATISAVAFVFASRKSSAEAASSCIRCHSTLEGRLSEPTRLFDHDIHRERGLSCTDCHGGDAAKDDMPASHDLGHGFTGKPTTAQIPAFCGKCHSDASFMKKFNPSLRVDQIQEYYTSVHGTRLKNGDEKVATCVSCHGVHGIRKPDDPESMVFPLNVAETCGKCHGDAQRMGSYGIAHDQYDKYKTSVHAKALYEKHDLSAPTCNDCHGNHGAVPPGLTSVANVCGQCHGRQASLFQDSPHKAPFEKLQAGECIRCHSNHGIVPPTDAMAGTGAGSVCTQCHKDDKGFAGATRIGGGMEKLNTDVASAGTLLDLAERAGMEVSKPKFELREASDALTQARVLVHTANPEEVEKALGPGEATANKSYQAGLNAFAELAYRRRGLIISLVFILFLASLVYLKIRQIEGKSPFARAVPETPSATG
jgi:predicted CXXCH cytochrome family protein